MNGSPPAPGMPGPCGDCQPCGEGCEPCGRRCLRSGCYVDGKDLSYNCGCQGSYKHPVPPQYTYHWPGMYSQRLMTDYHSPWRFPPLKPYTEEVKTQESRPANNTARLQRSGR